jgi:hypothetical protein
MLLVISQPGNFVHLRPATLLFLRAGLEIPAVWKC